MSSGNEETKVEPINEQIDSSIPMDQLNSIDENKLKINENKINENKIKKEPFSYKSLIMPSIIGFIATLFSLFVLFGYYLLNLDYACFYFNSLRFYEDENLFVIGYRKIFPEKVTMYGNAEKRYFDFAQPIISPKGARMSGSYFSAPYPDYFPIKQNLQYRLFKNNEQIEAERFFLDNRLRFIRLFDDTVVRNNLRDFDTEKLETFKEIKNSADIKTFFADNQTLTNLNIFFTEMEEDFIAMYKKGRDEKYNQKIYIKLSNNKVEYSEDFKTNFKNLIDNLPFNENLIEKSKNKFEKLTLENSKGWFSRQGHASPYAVDNLVYSRLAYLFLFRHSDIQAESFNKIKKMESLLKEIEKTQGAIKEELAKSEINKSTIGNLKKEISKLNKEKLNLRNKYIVRAFSILCANLFEGSSKKRNFFPFNKEKDPRNIILKKLSVNFAPESSDFIKNILSVVFQVEIE